MKTNLHHSREKARRAGYSLVEVTVAASIIMIGIAAACTMTLAMISQEEGNVRAGRALNYMENAMNLYQLGIGPSRIEFPSGSDPAAVDNLLPHDNAIVALTVTPNPQAIAGIGTPDRADMQLEFTTSVPHDGDNNSIPDAWQPGSWTGGSDGSTNNRTTAVMSVYRTSFRATGS